MSPLPLAWLCSFVVAAAPARWQETKETTTVEVRVTTSAPGSAIVDRGSADGLARGDRIVLKPRGGGTHDGFVTEALERIAKIELNDRGAVLAAGTRGEVTVLKSRLAKAAPPAKPAVAEPKQPPAPPKAAAPPSPAAPAKKETADHPPWKNQDESFAKGMPLLSQVKPLRPEERAMQVSGRAWALADVSRTDDARFSNSAFRGGVDLTAENPFGTGGALRFDSEALYRTEQDDGHQLDLLPRRLSYAWGGTRFEPTRLEFGRFLQFGVPEFGVVDGVEWTRRTEGGDRLGVSAGYMPEPDDDFGTFEDFQVAAYYQWNGDDSERLAVTTGLQKSFHDWSSDRDLLVARIRRLSVDGWDLLATAWVDYYGAGDHARSSPLDLTQAVASLARHFEGGDSLDLTFRHVRFPDIDRQGEFTPITLQELEDNRLDRLALSGSTWWSDDGRFHGQVGAWNDEDDSGGFGEAGVDVPALFLDEGRTDLTVFVTAGPFTSIWGARLGYGGFTATGRWDVVYEISDHRQDGFTGALQDLVHQRVFASRSFTLAGGWSVAVNAQALYIDRDLSWSAGAFVQKNF